MARSLKISHKQWTLVVLSAAGIAMSTGCGNFFTPQGQPTPAVNMSTQTQVYDDPVTLNKLYNMPRPYQPVFGQWQEDIAGSTAAGSAESFGSTPGDGAYTVFTDKNGNLTEKNLRVNASWDISYNWEPLPQGCVSSNPLWNGSSAKYEYYLPNPANPISLASSSGADITLPAFFCQLLVTDLQTVTPQVVTGTPPATMTITYKADPILNPTPPGPLTGLTGTTSILVYNSTGTVVSNYPITSASPDGYTATFTFPKQTANGSALVNGIYGTVLVNNDPYGDPPTYLGGEGFFTVGSTNSSYAEPFGVAAQDTHMIVTVCVNTTPRLHSNCSTNNTQIATPVVTSFSGSTISSYKGTSTVGHNPVQVLTYGTASNFSTTTNGDVTIESSYTGTGYALVVNYGSNTVNVVNLILNQVLATVAVGSEPVAAVIDATNSYAYVANYASNTVSKVSLSTYAAVATIAVGTHPSAVALDGSGNLWVGGSGFLNEYNSQTYALLKGSTVTGVVNALAVSSAQNRVLASTVQPSSPTLQAQIATSVINSNAAPAIHSSGSGNPYASSAIGRSLPTPYLLGGGTLVSANYKNNLSISATPGGFIVQDIYTGAVLASGTTASPVRSIAVDQTFGYAYLTEPDSGQVVTYPMPGSN